MKYYHYTPEFRLEEIIQSGVIKLAKKSVSCKFEKAVAWVSSNSHWENTATKMAQESKGNLRFLTFEQQVEMFGCARIEIRPFNRIHNWYEITKYANMRTEIIKVLEKTGLERGGNPNEWYSSLKPIPMEQWIKVEQFIDGKWLEIYNFETQTQLEIADYETRRINY